VEHVGLKRFSGFGFSLRGGDYNRGRDFLMQILLFLHFLDPGLRRRGTHIFPRNLISLRGGKGKGDELVCSVRRK